jgi:hypothetical protein
MAIRVVPFTANEVAAVRAFNDRMTAAQAAVDFLLPTSPNPNGCIPRAIQQVQYLAVDDGEAVRGGVLEVDHEAVLAGAPVRVCNFQSPLSEGIADSRYALVALQILKFLQRKSPYAFIVGMGHRDRPLPRLLAAAGWTIRTIPFLVRPVRYGRVLTQLPMLRQKPAMSIAARVAAVTGAAWVGGQALRLRRIPAVIRSRGFSIEPIREWGDWATDLWQQASGHCSFAVQRDRQALDILYPLHHGPCLAFVVRRGPTIVGWIVGVRTTMRDDPHFGNLTVATVLDCVSAPGASVAVACLGASALERGADLLITNQSHVSWVEAFRSCGFLPGPSNYLLATSKPLSEAIAAAGADRVHVVRGDGDGRIHL